MPPSSGFVDRSYLRIKVILSSKVWRQSRRLKFSVASVEQLIVQGGRPRGQFPMVSLEFLNDIILPATPWPWG